MTPSSTSIRICFDWTLGDLSHYFVMRHWEKGRFILVSLHVHWFLRRKNHFQYEIGKPNILKKISLVEILGVKCHPQMLLGFFLQKSSSLLKPLVSKVVVNCKHLITILWSVLHQFDQSPLKNLNCFVFFKKTEDFLVKILLAKNVRFQVSQYTSSQMWIKQHKTFCT